MSTLVLYEARPPAVIITLNRADKRNALSRALIDGLRDASARYSRGFDRQTVPGNYPTG